MAKNDIIDHTGLPEGEGKLAVFALLDDFAKESEPLERPHLLLLRDQRTGAIYVECHIRASKLIKLGTTDVPLDP